MRKFGFQTFSRIRLGVCSAMTAAIIAGCGGGGTAVDSSAALKDCIPGVITGFKGNFDDLAVRIIEGEEGAEGVGAAGAGAPGIGAGGSLGQFTNVDVSVEFSTGEKFGPSRVDSEKGMVTIVPCNLAPPALVKLVGAPGSGALYFDEALDRNVPFEGRQLRSVITSFDKNAGMTTFTEAMVRRAERIATTKSNVSAKYAWKDIGRINAAHDEILSVINRQLPGIYQLDDLRRLPVILNAERSEAGSNAITDDQNGRYGAALAGIVSVAAANLGKDGSPALEINDQLTADLSDGLLDLLDNGSKVASDKGTAYTYESFWQFQVLATTQAAQRSGTGSIAQATIPLDQTTLTVPNANGPDSTFEITHSSNGQLTYFDSVSGCPENVRQVPNVRQKKVLSAISQDGKTLYTPVSGAAPCEIKFEHPFTVPNASIASMDDFGDFFRATNGRFYYFFSDGSGGDPWWELDIEGPRPVYVSEDFGFLWTLTDQGEIYQYTYSLEDGLIFDSASRTVRPQTGSGVLVRLPNPVVQIANSGDNRETFALTTTGEVFWLDLRDQNGFRDPAIAPFPVSLGGSGICSMSRGLIVVSCDGSFHQIARAESDPSAPPLQDLIESDGTRYFIPGTGAIAIEPPVPSTVPIWRSTDQLAFAEGSIVPFEIKNPARLIGIDGSLRTLSGEIVLPAIR